MKHLLLILVLSSCGANNLDNRYGQQDAAVDPGPMVLDKKVATAEPFETRISLAYGTNICKLDGSYACKVISLDGKKITLEFFDAKGLTYSGQKTFEFVNNGDPVVELAIHDGSKKMTHIEITDKYTKLVHPGNGQGEIVIATWTN